MPRLCEAGWDTEAAAVRAGCLPSRFFSPPIGRGAEALRGGVGYEAPAVLFGSFPPAPAGSLLAFGDGERRHRL